jgi:hypothetical protein
MQYSLFDTPDGIAVFSGGDTLGYIEVVGEKCVLKDKEGEEVGMTFTSKKAALFSFGDEWGFNVWPSEGGLPQIRVWVSKGAPRSRVEEIGGKTLYTMRQGSIFGEGEVIASVEEHNGYEEFNYSLMGVALVALMQERQ